MYKKRSRTFALLLFYILRCLFYLVESLTEYSVTERLRDEGIRIYAFNVIEEILCLVFTCQNNQNINLLFRVPSLSCYCRYTAMEFLVDYVGNLVIFF